MKKVVLFALMGVLLNVTLPGHGQGSPADYQRANTIGRRAAELVFRASVKPHWIDDNHFWYRNDLADGRREFFLVDASEPSREPAFNNSKLAVALGKELGKPVDPERLPIDNIGFVSKTHTPLIRVGEKTFEVDTTNYSVKPSAQALDSGGARAYSPFGGPRASGNSTESTALTFVNHAGEQVSLYWLDTEGQRHEYGVIAPNEQRVMQTYVSHVWLVTHADGRPLVIFRAGATPERAVIEANSPQPERRQRVGFGGVSPDGKWRIAIHDYNLFLRDAKTGQETQLTQDGTAADFYEGRSYWSPDSTHLVAFKTIPAQEHKVYLVESSPKDQEQPKVHINDYLKPGDQIAHQRPHLFDLTTHKDIPIKDEMFPNPWDISEVEWEPDSKSFTFLYNQRGHQVMRLIGVDAATGEARTIINEQQKTFIDYTNKVYLERLPATHEAIWMSERDGWNHLYLYDTQTGQVKNQITQGKWVVRGVDKVDPEKRQIWFHAGGIVPGQDPYYIQYARVNFDGAGLTLLTEGDGTHTIDYSPNNKYLVDTYSRIDMPAVTTLRRVSDGAKLLNLEKGDDSALLQTGWRYPERFVAKGRDGTTDIYGVIVRPSNFDPKRKYPVVENIYAGPQGAFVPKGYGQGGGLQSMAELGFIVVQIDGMGTNFRSKAFHDVCWKNLSDAGFPDRILWMKAAAAKYSEMDLTRVGIYGTSAGGQNALSGLLLHGDFYKVGVADCGCHDNRMDKIWWNEQWMGWPVGPEYAANSNVTLAPKLQGKLFLMVGEMDTNVDPASTMQVVNALIKANKDFDLLVMPGQGHGVAGTPYGRRRLQDFLVRNLLGVEPRVANNAVPNGAAPQHF